jgi:DNA-directed RNA polymerase specialized sigma24 family protein
VQTDSDSERDSGVSTVDAAQSSDAAVYEALRDDIGRYAVAAGGQGVATDIVVNAMRRVTAQEPLSAISEPRRDMFQAVLEESRALLGSRPATDAATGSLSRQPPPVLGQSPESLALDPEVRQAVLTLPPRQRAAAYLTHWQECSLEDTADLMGCRPASARRYLRLARRHLKRTLGRDVDYRGTFRAVFETVVEPVPPTLDWPDMQDRIIQAPPLGRSPRQRLIAAPAGRWVWAVAAAIIVIVIVGGSTLLFGGEGEDAAPVIASPEVSTTLPAPTTTLPTATTTTPTTLLAVEVPMTWRRANVESLVVGEGFGNPAEYINSIALAEGRWVGVGFADMPVITGVSDADGFAAAFWTSPNGIDWERLPHNPEVFGNPEEFFMVEDVAALGSKFVAVGYALDRAGYDLTPYAEFLPWVGSEYWEHALWLSEDGQSWSRVEPTGLGGIVGSVAAGGPGLVAVGDREDGGSGVWTSVDGTDWQPVEPNPFPEDANVQGISSDRHGLLAVGNIDLQPTIWFSADGASWESSKLTPDGADIRGETQAVVRLEDTIVGAGFAAEDPEMGEHVAGIWVSNDAGVTWDQVPPFTSTARVVDLFGLVSTPEGLVASGMKYDWNDPDWRRGGIWTSVDSGSTWQEIPNEDSIFGDYAETGATIFGVEAFSDMVLALGFAGGEPAIWIGEWTD